MLGEEKGVSSRSHFWKYTVLISLLLGLMVGGVYLVHYVSRNPVHMVGLPEQKESVDQQAPVDTPSEYKKDPAPVQPVLGKHAAEQNMARFLRGKRDLDNMGGAQWGGELYRDILNLGQEADTLLMKEEYLAAADQYELALSRVGELNAQSPDIFRRLVEQGHDALASGDFKRAQESYSLALMIDADSEPAQRGLDRAKKIETVTQLMGSGRRHESEKQFSFALADYREASRLDPESTEAQTALNRVKSLIVEDQFQELMSSGFRALHDHQYEVAQKEFLKARSFKPDSNEVRDALAQVDQAIRLAHIEVLRKQAVMAEQSEDWARALESYLQVLELDRNIRFAALGKERSLEQIRILKRIDFYLEKPGTLESDRHLENAVLLLQETSKIEPTGPRLATKAEELSRLVKVAQTPVRVALESDNLTDVAVYKVGRLGRFFSKDLPLRPGSYTVVGTRDGYKDTRQTIAVKPGHAALHVVVICREKI